MSERSMSYQPPRGMRDFYPEDMALRDAIFDAWIAASRQHGFARYDSCVVESLALLKRKGGEEIVDQIYAFKDKSGRDLALRPEMTPSLARMIAARQNGLTFPLKWSTIAQCFRYERMTKGRRREHYQWNLDVVGEDSVAAEAEVLSAAVSALKLMGLKRTDFKILVNNRALVADMLEQANIEHQHHASVFLALDKRGKLDDDKVAELLEADGLDKKAISAALGITGVNSLDGAAQVVGQTNSALTRLRDLLELCRHYGFEDAIQFDISVVRGLDYYTGIVFEAFDAQRQFRAIFGGGRYDNLLANVGGKPMSGVGMGFGDVVIAEVLAAMPPVHPDPEPLGTAVGFLEEAQRSTATSVAATLRSRGQNVDLALQPQKAKPFFSRAAKNRRAEAIFIGPDDVAKHKVRVKDLATRQEREAEIDDL